MLVPIRLVTILITCTCTLVCVGITLTSMIIVSDEALKDVKDSQDSNVKTCFAKGEESLLEMTKDKIELQAKEVELSIQKQLEEARTVNTMLGGLGLTLDKPSEQAATLEAPMVKMWDSTKISIIGFMADKIFYTLVENSLALEVNTQLGYRHENSTSYLFLNETSGVSTLGNVDHLRGTYSSEPCNPVELLIDWTGTVASGPCPLPNFDPYAIDFVNEALLIEPGSESSWSGISSFSTFIGVMIRTRVTRDPSDPALTVSSIVGFDMKSISVYLKQIVSPSGDERIFLTVGGLNEQTGLMLGASHGSWHTELLDQPDPLSARTITVKVAQHCTNASDEVVRGASTWLYSQAPLGTDVFAAHKDRQAMGMQELTVNGSQHYLQVAELRDEYGLEWWVLVSVLKESVVGATQERREQTVADIEESNSSVDRNTNNNRIILICVVAGVTLVLMLLTAVAATNLTSPLQVLSDEMWDVAQLRLDDVDETAKQSMLLEVNSMQKSFLMMLYALREYRQFMPQAVADIDASDPDDRDDASSIHHSIMSSEGISQMLSSTQISDSIASSLTSPVTPATALTNNSKHGKKQMPNQHALLALNMVRRKCVSQVSIENPDFERFISEKKDGSAIVEYHSHWLQRCVMDVKDLRGTVERFIGDHVDINFGGIMPCPSPSGKACEYALRLRERMGPIDMPYSFTQSDSLIVLGIATGACYAGNLGCQGMKAPSTLGKTCVMARNMMMVARDVGVDIVMDWKCSEELRGVFTTTIVDILKIENRGKVPCYYANGFKKDVGGEWMYTMKDDGEAHYDAAWSHIMQGDITKGVEALRGITPAEPVTNLVISRIVAYCEAMEKATGKQPTDYFRLIANRAVIGPLTEQFIPAPRLQLPRQPIRSPLAASIIAESMSPASQALPLPI